MHIYRGGEVLQGGEFGGCGMMTMKMETTEPRRIPGSGGPIPGSGGERVLVGGAGGADRRRRMRRRRRR